MATIKERVYNIFYTTLAGYSALGWLISLVTYGTLILYDLHSTWPTIPTILITIASPFAIFGVLWLFGHFFVKHGGYGAQFVFADQKNPQRLNWELQLAWINLNIAECSTLLTIAKKTKTDTADLQTRIVELEKLKAPIEALLGIESKDI